MRTLLFVLIFVFGWTTTALPQQRAFIFSINEEIAPPAWHTTKLALEQAIADSADFVVLKLNTYGGQVDIADSIRTKLMLFPIPVYVLIENNAASAGALISLACDSIYMTPGSTIGAATVVNQNGEQVPDKYQSYMRKKMRATAEHNGRNPDIAEAMVDPDKIVPGVSDSGKVVTFTVEEAIKFGFCEAQVNSVDEVLERVGAASATKITYAPTTIDKIIKWLISPYISGLLLLVIIGGIYFELQSPGIGFPLAAALLAAVVYFAPYYLQGLAENWEILLFVIGVLLIGLELFVIPGFGIAGISGIILVIAGLTTSMVGNNGFDFTFVLPQNLITSFIVATSALLVSVVGIVLLAPTLLLKGPWGGLVLKTTQPAKSEWITKSTQNLVELHSEGIALTRLMPGGKVEINGVTYDAVAQSGYIEQGAAIQVISTSTVQLIVKAHTNESTNG